jgi:hypothetical protein
MPMNNKTGHKIRTIRTPEDLKLEKARLRLEIARSEDHVKTSYRHLVDSLTFKNILHAAVENFATTSEIISTVVTTGKSIFGRKRKKKRKDSFHEENPSAPDGNNE